MIAIIKTGGKQYVVKPGQKLKVEKLAVEEGKEVTFNEVLLMADEKDTKIGAPLVAGASVKAKVLKQARAPKVTGVKFKNKTRYTRTFGHRQHFTQVEITTL